MRGTESCDWALIKLAARVAAAIVAGAVLLAAAWISRWAGCDRPGPPGRGVELEKGGDGEAGP